MCIQFAERSGSFDYWSPLVNFIGNGLVIAGVGAGTALITALALKALGYSSAAIKIGTAVPLIAGTLGLAAAAIGVTIITGLFICILWYWK